MSKKTKTITVEFEGVDFWSRPVYKDVNTIVRYGSVNTLFPDTKIAPNGTKEEINAFFRENIEDLVYFGSSFDCEPNGGMPSHYKLNIID